MTLLRIFVNFLDKRYPIKISYDKITDIWITLILSIKSNIPDLVNTVKRYSKNYFLLNKYLRITTCNGLPVTEENLSNFLCDKLTLNLRLPDRLSLTFIRKDCDVDISLTIILPLIDELTYDYIIDKFTKFHSEELILGNKTLHFYKKEFLKQQEMINITKRNFLNEFFRDKGNDLWYFNIKNRDRRNVSTDKWSLCCQLPDDFT